MAVPQTDTGGLVENTKAIERTISKELGKTAGRKLCKMPSPIESGRSERISSDCLTKTQGSANPKGDV